MSRSVRLQILSDLMLLAVAVVWGSSYGVAKSALAYYPVLGLLALRFGITFVLLLPALRPLRDADSRALKGVLGAGLLLLSIFLCETFGLMLTRAANVAFLIGLCVVMTPLVEWSMLKRRPSRMEWTAVAVSLLGAWLLTGGDAMTFNRGDALILVAALLRAVTACVTKRLMRDAALPPLTVTAVQSGVVALGSAVAALAFARGQWQHVPSLAGHPMFWACVFYLVLACTLFAFFAQNYGIKHSNPTRVALLMGSEPAFGALFACMWLGGEGLVCGVDRGWVDRGGVVAGYGACAEGGVSVEAGSWATSTRLRPQLTFDRY